MIVDVKAPVSCDAHQETYAVYVESLVAALNSPLSARGLMLLGVKFVPMLSISVEDTQHHNSIDAITMKSRKRELCLLAGAGVTWCLRAIAKNFTFLLLFRRIF